MRCIRTEPVPPGRVLTLTHTQAAADEKRRMLRAFDENSTKMKLRCGGKPDLTIAARRTATVH